MARRGPGYSRIGAGQRTEGPVPDSPSYDRPPVVEVSLSVQFEGLTGLGIPQLGLLWGEFKDRLPQTEQHPPLPAIVEDLGPPRPRRARIEVEVLESPLTPRSWFVSRDGTEVVQVQNDRFVYNWRKRVPSDTYPRYEHVREQFVQNFRTFVEFLARENLGNPEINQCEMTYLNHIERSGVWDNHGEMDKVVTIVSPEYSDDFLARPESIDLEARYLIQRSGNALGRLHVAAQPRFRIADKEPVLALTLTARGAPGGDGLEGSLDFFDLGRDWIVRGFTSITRKTMHEVWGRNDSFD